MFLIGLLIFSLSFAAANYDIDQYFGNYSAYREKKLILQRRTRDMNSFFKIHSFSCSSMAKTEQTAFIVILLYKAEGRFIGMGSIINRKTVLSAAKAVELSMQHPEDLICLAGRMGPWWGHKSQVKRAEEIFINDKSLALINLREPFVFTENVAPIKLVQEEVKDYVKEYTADNAVFGITRSSWDIPGDVTPKTARYMMKIESIRTEETNLDICKTAFPDFDMNDTAHICTSANGTFCWGCIGSPTIAVSKYDELLQIAVITKTTDLSDKDDYHIHTKIGPYVNWLRSHSHLDYVIPGPIEDNTTPPPPPTKSTAQ